MNKSRFQLFLVISLLGLLGILAFFQYKWVGQISEAEQERLQKRLDVDSQNFAQDFNRIIQTAYFNFQFAGENWYYDFLDHYARWQQHSPYPNLIKEFTVIQVNGERFRFDPQSKQLVSTNSYTKIDTYNGNFDPIDEDGLILRMPVYEQPNRVEFVRRSIELAKTIQEIPPPIQPQTLAIILIKLDEDVIKNQIIPDLTRKYFPEGDFRLSVFSKKQNAALFGTASFERADATSDLFELMPENIALFVNQDLLSTLNNTKVRSQFVFNQQMESRVSKTVDSNGKVQIKVIGNKQNQKISGNPMENSGRWQLFVQHKEGSLEQFVGTSRRKNLLISYGILGLLGASIGLIFLSARRAQVLAQRQLDFVSAVSHEFRTPIAVIYSAAENLADGVAREGSQIYRYGNLIKGEGKKLSAMVEQILEFAGARSGRKKYDFRESNIKNVVESALKDCEPLIAEKHFEVETEIQNDLPSIRADSNALSHAVQNLIINGIKYSNGSNWLKISAKNGGGTVKITVEDKGIGIAKKDLKQIFTPFYRAKDVVDAQIHGNGLGLSLVKQTVDAHHGKIEVESETGKGSRFVIALPTKSIEE